MAEYEALLVGLTMAVEMQAEAVVVRSDSKLVVGYWTGEFEAKGDKMKKYAEKAWELQDLFKKYKILNIPRVQNGRADQLARLATVPQGESKSAYTPSKFSKLRR